MRNFPAEALYAPNWEEDNRPTDFGPVLVETRVYMTLRQQIERALAAGVLQENWRRAHFPADFDVPDDYWPPDYAPEEQDIMAEYQYVVDGRTRTMARLERAQRKAEEAEGKEAGPVTDPREEAPEAPEA